MAITTRSGKVVPGPSMGKSVIDDMVELDEEVKENSPVEFKKLDGGYIPSNYQQINVLDKYKG